MCFYDQEFGLSCDYLCELGKKCILLLSVKYSTNVHNSHRWCCLVQLYSYCFSAFRTVNYGYRSFEFSCKKSKLVYFLHFHVSFLVYFGTLLLDMYSLRSVRFSWRINPWVIALCPLSSWHFPCSNACFVWQQHSNSSSVLTCVCMGCPSPSLCCLYCVCVFKEDLFADNRSSVLVFFLFTVSVTVF